MNRQFCNRNFRAEGRIWNLRDTVTNQVCETGDIVFLKDVVLQVDLEARERDLKGTMGEHAGAIGDVIARSQIPEGTMWKRTFYFYKLQPHFFQENEFIPVTWAEFGVLAVSGFWLSSKDGTHKLQEII